MRRKITEQEREAIRVDREEHGMTLPQLVEKHGRARSTIHNLIKDMSDSKVLRAAPSRKVVESVEFMKRPSLSKADLGEAARQIIAGRLIWNGIKVFMPLTEDTPIDLLILGFEGRILKCQCKYIWPESRTGCHSMALFATRKNSTGTKARKHVYSNDEVDFFLGYCGENDSVYVIPYAAAEGRHQLRFWIARLPANYGNITFRSEQYMDAYHLLK